jgi:hypothetical protein
MKQVFAGEALEAVLAAAQRPPDKEDSRTDRSPSLGGLRRSFVTNLLIIDRALRLGMQRRTLSGSPQRTKEVLAD